MLRKAHLLALIDGMVFWTPEYLNRERSTEQFDEWLAVARFDNAPPLPIAPARTRPPRSTTFGGVARILSAVERHGQTKCAGRGI